MQAGRSGSGTHKLVKVRKDARTLVNVDQRRDAYACLSAYAYACALTVQYIGRAEGEPSVTLDCAIGAREVSHLAVTKVSTCLLRTCDSLPASHCCRAESKQIRGFLSCSGP